MFNLVRHIGYGGNALLIKIKIIENPMHTNIGRKTPSLKVFE